MVPLVLASFTAVLIMKKKETEQKLKTANGPIPLVTWMLLVVENDAAVD